RCAVDSRRHCRTVDGEPRLQRLPERWDGPRRADLSAPDRGFRERLISDCPRPRHAPRCSRMHDVLRSKLARSMARAIADFRMISEGDRILCAVSGGKDSYAMHDLLVELARRAPVRFEIVAVNIDQGHPGYPAHVLEAYMRERGDRFVLVRE